MAKEADGNLAKMADDFIRVGEQLKQGTMPKMTVSPDDGVVHGMEFDRTVRVRDTAEVREVMAEWVTAHAELENAQHRWDAIN